MTSPRDVDEFNPIPNEQTKPHFKEWKDTVAWTRRYSWRRAKKKDLFVKYTTRLKGYPPCYIVSWDKICWCMLHCTWVLGWTGNKLISAPGQQNYRTRNKYHLVMAEFFSCVWNTFYQTCNYSNSLVQSCDGLRNATYFAWLVIQWLSASKCTNLFKTHKNVSGASTHNSSKFVKILFS